MLAKMKIFISALIIAGIFFLFCDSSNPVNSNNGPAEFSPPGWIWGTWQSKYNLSRFVFSEDNVVWIITQNSDTTDFKQAYNADEMKESINSDTEYRITWLKKDYYFHFKKVSATEMHFWDTGDELDPWELKKVN